MVEYAYRDLFYKSHQTKDILIVDEMANVTPVTGAAPTVTNATVEIHTADVKTNTFRLEESLCSEDNLTWGLLESAEVSFTINNKASIPNLKTNTDDLMLNIYIYFNGDSDTLFQVGQYICYSDKYSADRRTREIVLYDANHFLRDWDITEWYNEVYADNDNEPLTVKELRDSLFDYIAQEFDYVIEQNEETELVNDDYYVPKNIESDTITFGFFMGGLLNANGVFGHISRTGVFEYLTLVKYDAETVGTVTDDFRKPPTTYEDFAVWGIGFVRVYDQNNIQLAYEGSSSYRHPSVYNIVDNFVLSGIKSLPDGEDNIKQATLNIREQVTHRRYAPMSVKHVGDLCIEVGDNIKVVGDIGEYNTYVLERHLKGLGSMLDTYTSRGNRKQPKYQINDKWHVGDSQNNSADGAGGIGNVNDESAEMFIKYCRNTGIRFLQEPSNISAAYTDKIKKTVSAMYVNTGRTGESNIHDGDTTNPISVWDSDSSTVKQYTVTEGDYLKYDNRAGNGTEYPQATTQPLYVFDGSKWVYVGIASGSSGTGTNEYYGSIGAAIAEATNNEIYEGSTCNHITLTPYTDYFTEEAIESTPYRVCGKRNGTTQVTEAKVYTPIYGDIVYNVNGHSYVYQYPGVWHEQYPVLTEPIEIEDDPHVELKWTDPSDITSNQPEPQTWVGTIVVRSETGVPVHPWDDCEILVNSTTRDEYSTTPFKDYDVDENKKYYYGIFPYSNFVDNGVTKQRYRFTKVVSVNTQRNLLAPLITSIILNGTVVEVGFEMPVLQSGTYTLQKLGYKKGAIPNSLADCDGSVDLEHEISPADVTTLDNQARYYFVIFATTSKGDNLVSDPEYIDYNIGRLMLIDSYSNYRHPIVELENAGYLDGQINKETCYAWYQEDGTFMFYDRTQAQAKFVPKTALRKGTATKMVIEVTTKAEYNYPDFGWGLLDVMPTMWGYPLYSQDPRKGRVLKWLYDFASQTKATYELSLADIDKNKIFYLVWYRNSTRNVTYKMYFDGIPEFFVLDDLTTWNKYLPDDVINITKNGLETTVVFNGYYGWEHIIYEADVEENTNYAFAYDVKCTSGERQYTANQMAAYILGANPEDNGSWWDYNIISENGGRLNELGNEYHTYTTTFNSGSRKKIWIAINYSAIADSERNVTFVYKNIRLYKT